MGSLVIKFLSIYLFSFAKSFIGRLDEMPHEYDRSNVVIHAYLLVNPMKHFRLKVRQPNRVEAVNLIR